MFKTKITKETTQQLKVAATMTMATMVVTVQVKELVNLNHPIKMHYVYLVKGHSYHVTM